MAIFHFTVKIVGRSKEKSVISASAYLNGDVMKNEETGRISYYTSKKEVVYTSLMMCENAPPEWLHVPEENIKRFQQSIRYKRADDKDAALEKFKITFQKQRLVYIRRCSCSKRSCTVNQFRYQRSCVNRYHRRCRRPYGYLRYKITCTGTTAGNRRCGIFIYGIDSCNSTAYYETYDS